MESPGSQNKLRGLLAEVAGLASRLRRPGFDSQGRDLAGGLLVIAMGLRDNGPQTVPRIAQARQTSRQNIQTAVNRLKQLGLIELKANPAHKRSMLVELTARGRSELASAEEKEAANAGALLDLISDEQLAGATALLRKLRQELCGTEHRGVEATRARSRANHRRKIQETVVEVEPETEMPVSLL